MSLELARWVVFWALPSAPLSETTDTEVKGRDWRPSEAHHVEARWQSRIVVPAAVGSELGWIAAGVRVVVAGDRFHADWYDAGAAVHCGPAARALVEVVEGDEPAVATAWQPA